jgi:hypothetical protein
MTKQEFQKQAAKCRRLASGTDELTMRLLIELAEQYEVEASKSEQLDNGRPNYSSKMRPWPNA